MLPWYCYTVASSKVNWNKLSVRHSNAKIKSNHSTLLQCKCRNMACQSLSRRASLIGPNEAMCMFILVITRKIAHILAAIKWSCSSNSFSEKTLKYKRRFVQMKWPFFLSGGMLKFYIKKESRKIKTGLINFGTSWNHVRWRGCKQTAFIEPKVQEKTRGPNPSD